MIKKRSKRFVKNNHRLLFLSTVVLGLLTLVSLSTLLIKLVFIPQNKQIGSFLVKKNSIALPKTPTKITFLKGNGEIWSYDLTTKVQNQIFPGLEGRICGEAGCVERPWSISRDGKILAANINGHVGYRLLDSSDSSIHSIVEGGEPSISPSGEFIAFDPTSNSSNLAIYSLKTNKTIIIPGIHYIPIWISDSELLFGENNQHYNIIDANTGVITTTNLNKLKVDISSFNLSPANDRIFLTYYMSPPGGEIVTLKSSEISKVYPPTPFPDNYYSRVATWSPDGRYLLLNESSDSQNTESINEYSNKGKFIKTLAITASGKTNICWAMEGKDNVLVYQNFSTDSRIPSVINIYNMLTGKTTQIIMNNYLNTSFFICY